MVVGTLRGFSVRIKQYLKNLTYEEHLETSDTKPANPGSDRPPQSTFHNYPLTADCRWFPKATCKPIINPLFQPPQKLQSLITISYNTQYD